MISPSETLKYVGVEPRTCHALCIDMRDEDTVLECIEVHNVVNPNKLWKRRVFRIEVEEVAKTAGKEGIMVVLVDEKHRYIADFNKKIIKPAIVKASLELAKFAEKQKDLIGKLSDFKEENPQDCPF